MRSTFKLLFYINRNKVKSDGTTAVLCRISIDGKKSAVTTGVYCKPGDWDSKKCEIKTARENNRLAAFRSRLEEAYGNLLRNQGVVTAELLKTTVSGANSVPEYLLQAGEVERERLRVRSKEINSTSTYRQSKTTQLNLRQFIESHTVFADKYFHAFLRMHGRNGEEGAKQKRGTENNSFHIYGLVYH